ncbi:MAG: GGDEF domain-containing protein [Coriobacteriia bacterium]|nr:GGDEF domain-containing protein [Coriobacteriia bacterium]MBN2822386.1 GGDEF domain-containing protein [Coriobacteriia bacterium]
MTTVPNKGRIELDSGAFLFVRSAAAVFLIVLYLIWARGLETAPLSDIFLLGTVVWTLYTLGIAVARYTTPALDFQKLMHFTLPFDCVALGALVAATTELHDPFYVWVMLESMLYATVFRRARSWIYSAFLVVAYLIGHLAVPVFSMPFVHVIFLTMKVAAVLVIGWFVGLMIERQSYRADEAEERVDDATDLNQKLERSVAELRAVAEISEIIHSTLDFDSVGPVVLERLQKVIEIPAACIFVIDKDKGETLFSASRGLHNDISKACGVLDVTRSDLGVSDEHFACLELLDHNQMIVVFCADSQAIDMLDADDHMVLHAVAAELVVAVENSRLYKLTKRLAITDELTDLYNYRYLQQRLDDEIGRAKRYGKQLSFLMLDVDDFKAVNDTYGHLVGDGVLADLGNVIKSTVREVDIVARYGGEEFSVLLPETDASGAFIVAEKVREAVSMHRFLDAEGERTIHVTMSLGVANLPLHAEDKESLLRQADDALYQSKTTGKDRVRAPKIRLSRFDLEPGQELKP